MKLWFTSDLHLDHLNILTYCKGRAARWSSVEEMNEGLITAFNEVVRPADTTIFLGDVAMGKREESVPLLRRLHGYKILVPGNHDNCWDKGRDGRGSTVGKTYNNIAKYIEWAFHEVWQPPCTVGEVKWGLPPAIQNLILSHLPPAECGDHKAGEAVYEHEVRFVEHRPAYPPEDTWMLCGHVHEAWKVHGRVINVGVDVWDFKPVSVEQILAIMKTEEVGCGLGE